jgi:hypothetical protein
MQAFFVFWPALRWSYTKTGIYVRTPKPKRPNAGEVRVGLERQWAATVRKTRRG